MSSRRATASPRTTPKPLPHPPGLKSAKHPRRGYYSSIDQRPDGLYMTSSRAIGVVGIADTLDEAERIAEKAVGAIRGSVDHRSDIGTDLLIRKRVQHMKILKAEPI
jgi:phosphoribosylamine-glycine ligase